MHKTVLLNEAIDNLNIKEDGIYVDCTLGFGGHSGLILERIKRGFLFAFDQDDMALEYSEKKLKEIGSNFELIKSNFAYIKEELNKDKIEEDFDFSKIVKEVTPLEGVILLLKFGSITKENYSDEKLAEYLKISPETVTEKINHGMTLYKKITTNKQKVLKTKG